MKKLLILMSLVAVAVAVCVSASATSNGSNGSLVGSDFLISSDWSVVDYPYTDGLAVAGDYTVTKSFSDVGTASGVYAYGLGSVTYNFQDDVVGGSARFYYPKNTAGYTLKFNGSGDCNGVALNAFPVTYRYTIIGVNSVLASSVPSGVWSFGRNSDFTDFEIIQEYSGSAVWSDLPDLIVDQGGVYSVILASYDYVLVVCEFDYTLNDIKALGGSSSSDLNLRLDLTVVASTYLAESFENLYRSFNYSNVYNPPSGSPDGIVGRFDDSDQLLDDLFSNDSVLQYFNFFSDLISLSIFKYMFLIIFSFAAVYIVLFGGR